MDKDTNRQKDTQNIINLSTLSVFDNDPYFLYIYKKSEKIASALYMITDFLSDSEPLKTSIRNSSLSLIKKSITLNTTQSSDRKSLLDQIIQEALSLISYSQIAMLSAIVSVMNHQIVKRELELFIKTIEERELPHKLGKNFVLSTDFIKDEALLNLHNGKDHLSTSSQKSFHNEISHVSTYVSRPQVKSVLNQSQEGKKDRKNERQELIIATIRAKGELSIKDLTGVIKGCSEKTIQRELLTLVEGGILHKSGERRWSRYSIIA